MAGLEPATAASSAPFALHSNRTPDALAWLPEGAADRLRALRQHVADRHAVIPSSEDRLAASNAKIDAERRLARLQAHPSAPGGGFALGLADARVVEAERHLEEMTAAKARVDERYTGRSAAYRSSSGALNTCEGWLRSGPGPLRDHEAPEPKLGKGETVIDAIARLRLRVRELLADVHRIKCAPFPSAHARAQMRAHIDELARRGAPSVARLLELDQNIDWPMTQQKARVHNVEQLGAVAICEVPDTVAMFAWLHGPTLIKKLDGEIDAEADDASALSHEARQKAEAEVKGDLLTCERDEATLVWAAQAQGLPAEHRSDIDPRALLGVVLVNAPRANSGTTRGMALTIAGTR